MSREKDPECRALLLTESGNAMQVQSHKGEETWWIPRSQVGYLRKTKLDSGLISVVFTLPEWLIEEKQCWELVP